MKIIVLQGNSNMGKTNTIWKLREKLVNAGHPPVPNTFILHGPHNFIDDFEEIISVVNQKVAIISMGDYSNILAKRIHYYGSIGCDVLVCTLSNGSPRTYSPKKNARKAINLYNPVMPFTPKTLDFNESSQDHTNNSDAALLMALI